MYGGRRGHDPWKNYDNWKTSPPDYYEEDEEDKEIKGKETKSIHIATKLFKGVEPGDVYLRRRTHYYVEGGPSTWVHTKTKINIDAEIFSIFRELYKEIKKICNELKLENNISILHFRTHHIYGHMIYFKVWKSNPSDPNTCTISTYKNNLRLIIMGEAYESEYAAPGSINNIIRLVKSYIDEIGENDG